MYTLPVYILIPAQPARAKVPGIALYCLCCFKKLLRFFIIVFVVQKSESGVYILRTCSIYIY